MLSSVFQRPLLIYDDKCYSCAKFAMAARTLSRGWIRIAGHYYSEDARKAKEMVFRPGYDATRMFWLINKSGAHGARSGLLPVAREIIVGMFRGGEVNNVLATCDYEGTLMSCYTPTDLFKRLYTMFSHGTKFPFE